MDIVILGIDFATKTGWACNHPRQSGVQNFALKRGESPGMRFLRFHAWLAEILKLTNPSVIVYEQAHYRGGGATQVCAGMQAIVLEEAARFGVETMPVHSGSLKKWATGNGGASKNEMIRECKKRGYCPCDDNEADAILLMEYGINELGAA